MKDPIWKQINLYRIVPRIVLFFMLWLTFFSFNWFMSLEDPTAEQASVVIAVTGTSLGITKYYLDKPKTSIEGE